MIDPERLAGFRSAERELRDRLRETPQLADMQPMHQFLQMWPLDRRPQGWHYSTEYAVFMIYWQAGALDYYKHERF